MAPSNKKCGCNERKHGNLMYACISNVYSRTQKKHWWFMLIKSIKRAQDTQKASIGNLLCINNLRRTFIVCQLKLTLHLRVFRLVFVDFKQFPSDFRCKRKQWLRKLIKTL